MTNHFLTSAVLPYDENLALSLEIFFSGAKVITVGFH